MIEPVIVRTMRTPAYEAALDGMRRCCNTAGGWRAEHECSAGVLWVGRTWWEHSDAEMDGWTHVECCARRVAALERHP